MLWCSLVFRRPGIVGDAAGRLSGDGDVVVGFLVVAEVGGAVQRMALCVCLGSKQGGGSGSVMVLGVRHVVRISLPWGEGSIKGWRANGEATGEQAAPTQDRAKRESAASAIPHSLSGSCGFATRDGLRDGAGVESQQPCLGSDVLCVGCFLCR